MVSIYDYSSLFILIQHLFNRTRSVLEWREVYLLPLRIWTHVFLSFVVHAGVDPFEVFKEDAEAVLGVEPVGEEADEVHLVASVYFSSEAYWFTILELAFIDDFHWLWQGSIFLSVLILYDPHESIQLVSDGVGLVLPAALETF